MTNDEKQEAREWRLNRNARPIGLLFDAEVDEMLAAYGSQCRREGKREGLEGCADWIEGAIVMRRKNQTELEAVAEAIRTYARAELIREEETHGK